MICLRGQKFKVRVTFGLVLKHIEGDRVVGVRFCTLSNAQPLVSFTIYF